MKKLFLLVVVFSLLTPFALAQEAINATSTTNTTEADAINTVGTGVTAAASEGVAIMLKGDIIDNMCAGSQDSKELANFVKTHTKQCALMPNCIASGYSIFADGKLTKFDQESNTKIEEFLNKSDSKLQVKVVATKADDELSLVSLENQE